MKDALAEYIKITPVLAIAAICIMALLTVFRQAGNTGNALNNKNAVLKELEESRDLIAYDNNEIMPQDVVNLFATIKGQISIKYNGTIMDDNYFNSINPDIDFYSLENLMRLGRYDPDGDGIYDEYYLDTDDCLDYNKVYFSKIYRTSNNKNDVSGYIIFDITHDEEGNITGKINDEAYSEWD